MAVGFTALAAAHRPMKTHPVSAAPGIAPQASVQVEAPPEKPSAASFVASTERSQSPLPDGLGDPVAQCDSAFARRDWTAISATCAAASGARPRDSALAMRVAQAQHRRGHIADAAVWARKALALDAEIPEAFAIVAHAEIRAGHSREAADAYRQYLTLAPRGWHSAEARRALRAE